MTIKDLIITGICKLIRNASVHELIVEAVNEVTKAELDALKGMTGSIQSQLSAITGDVSTAQTLQTAFKGGIADGINGIPKPDAKVLSSGSTLSEMVGEMTTVKNNINAATVGEYDIVAPYKGVNKNGVVVTGTLPDMDGCTRPDSIEATSEDLYVRIPRGAYRTIPPKGILGGYTSAEIVVSKDSITKALGIDWDKILDTSTVFYQRGGVTTYPIFHEAYTTIVDGNYDVYFDPGAYMQTGLNGHTAVAVTFGEVIRAIGLNHDHLLETDTVLGKKGTITVHNESDTNSIPPTWYLPGDGKTVAGANDTVRLEVCNDDMPGYYPEKSYCQVYIPYSHMAMLIGLTSSAITTGNTILGISGTGIHGAISYFTDTVEKSWNLTYCERSGDSIYNGCRNGHDIILMPYGSRDIFRILTRANSVYYATSLYLKFKSYNYDYAMYRVDQEVATADGDTYCINGDLKLQGITTTRSAFIWTTLYDGDDSYVYGVTIVGSGGHTDKFKFNVIFI